MSDVVVKNLRVQYGEKVIFDDFNATFEHNKINVILGGSGVGKTTLLNVVAGIKEYDGVVEGVDGETSFIFQKERLIPTISVYKNLDLILKSIFKDKMLRKEKIEKMLATLEISDCIDKLPTEISGGQAQRVSIARAYLYPSKVLILDEPFKALDTALKSRLLKNLIMLNDDSPRTVLFVTHAIDECLLTADNFIVLGDSPAKIILQGKIESNKQNRRLTDTDLCDIRNELLSALV